MTSFGYLRQPISADRQTVTSHRSALRKAGATRLFIDSIIEPEHGAAPQLRAMLDEVARGDLLIVCSVASATGSLNEFLDLTAQLTALGVSVRCLAEAKIDTTTSQGRFFVTLLGALSGREPHPPE